MQVLEMNVLLESYSKSKTIAVVFRRDVNDDNNLYVGGRLNISRSDAPEEMFVKEFTNIEKAREYAMSFRSPKDLDLFYVSVWSDGCFITENT